MELKGSTLVFAQHMSLDRGDEDQIVMLTTDGRCWRFCDRCDDDGCERRLEIESVVGDLADLIGEPLLVTEEVVHHNETPKGTVRTSGMESFTWTCYKLATRVGYVDVRWHGQSNGNYSESVSLEQISSPLPGPLNAA